MRAAYGSQGYVAVIFVDASGAEITRDKVPIVAGTNLLGTARTDAEGKFFFTPNRTMLASRIAFLATFQGDDSARPSKAYLEPPTSR